MKYFDIDCPYCGKGQDIDHDDGYGYAEDEVFNQECSGCGSTFVYTTHMSFSYDAEKAECLNGADHRFEITTTLPKVFSKMRCSGCGEERELTNAERVEHHVPTREEFFARKETQ